MQHPGVVWRLPRLARSTQLNGTEHTYGAHNNTKQEAEKKIRLKRLPRVLTLHLKRFKYVESLDSFSKLSHRVVFPLELRTPNMTDEVGEADADGRLYR